MKTLHPQQYVKLYHYYYSTMMALALDEPLIGTIDKF